MALRVPVEKLQPGLLLFFAALQAVLAFGTFLLFNLTPVYFIAVAAYFLICLLLAVYSWSLSSARKIVYVIGFGLPGLLFLIILAGFALDSAAGGDMPGGWLNYHLVSLCELVQPLVLAFIIALCVAGFKKRRFDIRALWVFQCILLVLAAVTRFVLPHGLTGLRAPDYFSNLDASLIGSQSGTHPRAPDTFAVALTVYFILVLCTFLAIYLNHPFGSEKIDRFFTKRRKALTEEAAGTETEEAPEDEEKAD